MPPISVWPQIERSGSNEIVATLREGPNASTAQEEIGTTAQLYFYGWEPSVIGANGRPAPTEGTATGDATNQGAGGVTAGLLEYQAILRAAKRPPLIRPSDTTLTPGCTPAQIRGCAYGSWYLLGSQEQVLRGPGNTKQALYTDGYVPPGGATWKAVHVNPGTVLVQSRPVESATGEIVNASPNSWYVINDNPVLSGADLIPQQSSEAAGGQGLPTIEFSFTRHGMSVYEQMTREAARRGKEAQLPGISREAAEQHFAVVLDDQLIAAPSVNYAKYPDGISAASGSAIAGGLTAPSAENLANELRSGALPVRLTLISSSHLPAG